MTLSELVILLLKLAFPVRLQEEPDSSQVHSIPAQYCVSASLHGLKYIVLVGMTRPVRQTTTLAVLSSLQASSRLKRLLWVVLILFMATCMLYLTLPSLPRELMTTWKQAWELTTDLGDIPAPTLTLCAVQMGDRWNLARALLNQVKIPSKAHFSIFERHYFVCLCNFGLYVGKPNELF